MSKLIQNASLYTLGNLIPKAVSLILLPIYTRYLSPEDYGIVTSMEVLSGVLLVFFTMAIDRSIYRLYFEYKTAEAKREYLGTITIAIAVISVSVLLLLFIFRSLVGQIFKSIEFYPFYVYAILTVFLSVFSIVPKIYLQVNEKARKFLTLSILEFLLSSGLILWFVVVKKAGAVGMLEGRLFASIIILPLFLNISFRISDFKFKPEILKESLAFSLPMIPSLLAVWMLDLSDRIFIERYFSLSDVGIYSLGYKIAGLIIIFTSAFDKAYFPMFFRLANTEQQDEAKKKLYKYNNYYVLALLSVVFFISFFSNEAIVFLLDPKYKESAKIVPVIALAYFISQSSGLLNLSIYQAKKTKQIMYITLGSAGLNLCLNFLLVPRFGAYGAAYATVFSYGFFFVVKLWYAKKCYYIPFNWSRIALSFFPLAILTIVFQYTFQTFPYWSLLLKVLIVGSIATLVVRKYPEQFSRMLVFR